MRADLNDETGGVMNWLRLKRAWPFAAISILALCLALGILRDFAWILALTIILIGVFGMGQVLRETVRSADVPANGDGAGPK